MFYTASVRRIVRDRGVLLGLAALRELVGQAADRPIARSIQLRALLALMHQKGAGDVTHHRAFWDACGGVADHEVIAPERRRARAAAMHDAWYAMASACGFNPEAIEFNETLERLMLQSRHAAAARAVREAAVRPPKPNHDCGWL
jgi:hypothetical protein